MKHSLDLIYYNYPTKQLEKYIHLFDSIDWYNISAYQNLSEYFIEKHYDKVNWGCISLYQKLPEQFIKKHINKIDIKQLIKNRKISYEIIKEIDLLKEII